jgi:hypothetical protein
MIRIDDAVDMEYTEKKERRWKGCGSPIEPRREKKKKKKKNNFGSRCHPLLRAYRCVERS